MLRALWFLYLQFETINGTVSFDAEDRRVNVPRLSSKKMARSMPPSARKKFTGRDGDSIWSYLFYQSYLFHVTFRAVQKQQRNIVCSDKRFIVPRCSQFLYLRAVSKNLAESTVRSTAAGCILSPEINSESKLFAHGGDARGNGPSFDAFDLKAWSQDSEVTRS